MLVNTDTYLEHAPLILSSSSAFKYFREVFYGHCLDMYIINDLNPIYATDLFKVSHRIIQYIPAALKQNSKISVRGQQ